MKNGYIRFKNVCEDIIKSNSDIKMRKIKGNLGEIIILYISQLTDIEKLNCNIIKPIMNRIEKNNCFLTCDELVNKVIFLENILTESNADLILEKILDGKTIIFLPNEKFYVVTDIKKYEKKALETPELTFTVRGPRDAFGEHLDSNLSLIRYRIKDPKLKVEKFKVGKRTKSNVALLYIGDVANEKPINILRSRINKINIDGIFESGELQKALLNSKFDLFPQMGLCERSDMACGALLEGKAIVLIEGSGIALIAPKTFMEFLWSCDDIYDNQYFAVTVKILRQIAAVFSISLSSLFIIISSFQHDILPAEYIYTLAQSRANVPWNAFTGVLMLEIITEILREALLRVPKQIGPAVGIVGGITIGQAAISASVFSPLLLILVALELLSSFVAPDYTIMNSLRVCKFFLIFITGILDLYGFTLGFCLIISNLVANDSFGVSFLSPIAPFNLKDFFNSYFYNKDLAKQRPQFLKTKDKNRK